MHTIKVDIYFKAIYQDLSFHIDGSKIPSLDLQRSAHL